MYSCDSDPCLMRLLNARFHAQLQSPRLHTIIIRTSAFIISIYRVHFMSLV